VAPYKRRLIQAHRSGFEIWETGWGEPFTMWPENGRYEDWAYFKLLADVIGPTMPQNWNGPWIFPPSITVNLRRRAGGVSVGITYRMKVSGAICTILS
jgi:hypothetical protein